MSRLEHVYAPRTDAEVMNSLDYHHTISKAEMGELDDALDHIGAQLA